jgi:hypothetical protein
MSGRKLIVAFALILGATSATLAQGSGYDRPGPYFGNDYGPDNSVAQANPGGGADTQR